MKHFVCKEYECDVPDNHCLVCQHCTDVFYDITHGPYMYICELQHSGDWRNCKDFEYDGSEVREV